MEKPAPALAVNGHRMKRMPREITRGRVDDKGKPRSRLDGMSLWFDRANRNGMGQRSITQCRDTRRRRGSVKKRILAGLIVTLGFAPALGLAQTKGDASEQAPPQQAPAQGEERMVVGQIQSIDESGTELTLTDGTKLLTPPGSRLRPGVLNEGMLVVAMYREENGGKILTRLSLGQSAPAPGASQDAPKRRY